ncbi:hypothetical protein [Streptomyces hokutonensis]|uniref:hypothetical protein n=1 Tax=Streptomyces hokutonensis TaxID=1306990 RepID=UPI0033F04C58
MKQRIIIERPDPIPYETLIHEAALRVRVIPFDLNGFGGAGSAMVYAVSLEPERWRDFTTFIEALKQHPHP